MKKIICFLIPTIILLSCNSDDSTEYFLVAEGSDYTMKIPEYLSPINEKDSAFRYQNAYKEIILIAIEENKNDFVSYIKELSDFNENKSLVENLINFQIKQVVGDARNSLRKESGDININGQNAYLVKVNTNGESEIEEISYVFASIEGEENVYTIIGWTPSKNEEPYISDLEKAIKTFELK